jgi:coenzyme PQQ synthesis protein D (PqqD)
MTLKLRDGVFLAETEYGIALLDEDSGQYWNLNPTGALIVQTLLAGGSPAHAAEELTKQYAVDIDSASQDVQELVGELQSAGLVEKG